jgi:hypothetical protein
MRTAQPRPTPSAAVPLFCVVLKDDLVFRVSFSGGLFCMAHSFVDVDTCVSHSHRIPSRGGLPRRCVCLFHEWNIGCQLWEHSRDGMQIDSIGNSTGASEQRRDYLCGKRGSYFHCW